MQQLNSNTASFKCLMPKTEGAMNAGLLKQIQTDFICAVVFVVSDVRAPTHKHSKELHAGVINNSYVNYLLRVRVRLEVVSFLKVTWKKKFVLWALSFFCHGDV